LVPFQRFGVEVHGLGVRDVGVDPSACLPFAAVLVSAPVAVDEDLRKRREEICLGPMLAENGSTTSSWSVWAAS
jgi:hypothetical protein